MAFAIRVGDTSRPGRFVKRFHRNNYWNAFQEDLKNH